MLQGIHWLGHASFRIEAGGQTIYIDPWKLRTPQKAADLILITHGHGDHLSPADIALLRQPSTVIVVAAPYASQLTGDVRPIAAGQSLTIGSVTVEAVPSYNTNKPNHPASAGNVGFIVEVEGRRIYHGGDTDLIPEMSGFRCDVALVPAGGKYTMDAAEALEAIRRIQPKVAVPMHWGDIVGSLRDAQSIQQKAPQGVQVVLMTPEA